ncbi:MAG TPA: TetR/AcrR family transcriptional regulator [Chloroflexota bacterium]|nr:TetR/AcrR family transcriptional regulator [Chloroflexota bacterium]
MPRSVEAQERRDQILRAAVTVFGERGYAQATISEIASAAGLAHGTVYLYFRSKAEIFETLVGWFFQTLVVSFDNPGPGTDGVDAALAREGAADLPTELYQLFFRALACCAEYPRLAEVSLSMAHNGTPEVAPAFRGFENELVARLGRRLARAVEVREIRAVDPEEAAQIQVYFLGAAIERLLAQGSAGDPERIARSTVDFILHGLAPQKARNNSPRGSVSVKDASWSEQTPVGELATECRFEQPEQPQTSPRPGDERMRT